LSATNDSLFLFGANVMVVVVQQLLVVCLLFIFGFVRKKVHAKPQPTTDILM
jgi:hypothetical protein